jgi:lysophospholipase L1-like esterase
MDVDAAAHDLVCAQKAAPEDAIRIACVGDSITAGVHSSGGNHPYPAQLQLLLDEHHGRGKYSVTNLGACGSTMLKKGDSPYWRRPQFKALTAAKWDIVTVMLGTNDAKDRGSHGPNNWQHDCGGEHPELETCSFAHDYADMIELLRTLGTTPAGPKIYVMAPPPLMQLDAYGMNQTVINTVFPKLLPLIADANHLPAPVDLFGAMGGAPQWHSEFPGRCERESPFKPCAYFCDAQSCDQCHPNDAGYAHMASVIYEKLALPEVLHV